MPRGRPSTSFPPTRRQPRPELWPARDRAVWEAACRPGDGPFGDAGRLHGLSPATRQIYAAGYGRFLAWLAARDELDPDQGPADRVTPARAANWMAALRTQVGASTADQALINVISALQAMVPDRDWRWLRRTPGRPGAAEMRAARKLPRDVPDPVALAGALRGWVKEILACPPSPDSALALRDALVVAVATYHMPRRRNLAALRLGHEIQRDAGRRLRLVLTDTKTDEPQDVPLHPWVGDVLTTFIATYRPLLSARAAPGADHLWLCQDGTPLQATGMRALFHRVGLRLLGHPISPHRLRHAGATFLLKRAPREISRAAALLTHRSPRTTGAAYDVGGPEPALRLWRALMKDTARKGRM